MNNFEALVSLNLIPQIGSRRLSELLKYFGQPQAIFKASRESLARAVGENLGRQIFCFDRRRLEQELVLAGKPGLRIITLLDQDYPQALKEIPGPPIVLYCLGRISQLDNLALGIVGARRASLYGLKQAEIFAGQLSRQGMTIVSGMARGVDTYAHRGALKAKGRTLAIMGSGFNHIYPAENADLAQEISTSGAVISEFPMEAEPLAQNFPRRNRLISGLSLGILITEAARNSGALITADFALEQGREVFALPGRIDAVNSMGTNALLKQGAKIVTCCDDILEELDLTNSGIIKSGPEFNKASGVQRYTLPNRKGGYSASCGDCAGIVSSSPDKEIACAEEENRIYTYISRQPTGIDDLVQMSSLSSSQVLSLTLKLQLKKLIIALPGKQFMRS